MIVPSSTVASATTTAIQLAAPVPKIADIRLQINADLPDLISV
jgi:hypothetical protein